MFVVDPDQTRARAVADDLAVRGDVGGDDRRLQRHRLDQRPGRAFPSRREREDVGGAQQIRHVVACAQEFDDAGQAEIDDRRFQVARCTAVATGNEQADPRPVARADASARTKTSKPFWYSWRPIARTRDSSVPTPSRARAAIRRAVGAHTELFGITPARDDLDPRRIQVQAPAHVAGDGLRHGMKTADASRRGRCRRTARRGRATGATPDSRVVPGRRHCSRGCRRPASSCAATRAGRRHRPRRGSCAGDPDGGAEAAPRLGASSRRGHPIRPKRTIPRPPRPARRRGPRARGGTRRRVARRAAGTRGASAANERSAPPGCKLSIR